MMRQPGVPPAAAEGVCPRCFQPEDLLPIQQAVVVRSFPRRYAASFGTRARWGLPVSAPAPAVASHSWSPLAHVTFVSAMFGAACIELSEMLGHECLGPAHPLGGAPRAGGDPELEAVLARLDDQAECLGQTIMTSAAIRAWQGGAPQDGSSPHRLVHRVIDEATAHLQGFEGPHEAHLSFVGPGPPPRLWPHPGVSASRSEAAESRRRR